MSGELHFAVAGVPRPQGSARAYVVAGRAVVTSDNRRLADWRTALAWEARAAWAGRAALTGPVRVSLEFRLPRPKGHGGAGGSLRPGAPLRPTTRPDLDKLARAVLDALTEAGVVADDALVTDLAAAKAYADGPLGAGVAVTVTWP